MKSKKIFTLTYLVVIAMVSLFFCYYDIKSLIVFMKSFSISKDFTWFVLSVMLLIHAFSVVFLVVKNFTTYCHKTHTPIYNKRKTITNICLSTIALLLILGITIYCIVNNYSSFNAIKNELNVEQLKILQHNLNIQLALNLSYCAFGFVVYGTFIFPQVAKLKSNNSTTTPIN